MRGAVEERGSEAALAELADHFRAESRYHEFFEAQLMLCRQRAGLPLEAHFQMTYKDLLANSNAGGGGRIPDVMEWTDSEEKKHFRGGRAAVMFRHEVARMQQADDNRA